MEHLALEIFDLTGSGSQYANLPENASITITDTSEIFASGDVWSHSFTLNIPANLHIFGTAGEIHGSRLHEQINKRRARLWVEGLPLFLGYLKLDDEVEVDEDGNVDVTFESGQKTFDEMIEGAKANQVPIPDNILLGMALDRKRTLKRTKVKFARWFDGDDRVAWDASDCTIEGYEGFAQMFPRYVYPGGQWKLSPSATSSESLTPDNGYELINVESPYDAAHPYCNVRICYQMKEWDVKDSTLEEKTLRASKVSEAKRINPAPNFYVLFWMDMLMKHLGIYIEENQMMNVEDLRRLFFVNSKCSYKTKGDAYYGVESGVLLKATTTNPNVDLATPFVPITTSDNPAYKIEMEVVSGTLDEGENLFRSVGKADTSMTQLTWHKAYATSDNFPETDISEVIAAIEAGFGVRLLFSNDYQRVRIVLLRNIFQSNDIQHLSCDTISEEKTENCIRGFRMTYGGGEDDTSYNYKGFIQAKIDQQGGWVTDGDLHDYSQFDLSLGFDAIKDKVGMLNKTCYVDGTTGNAYIVKVDKDAKSAADEYYPSLFECAQYMDAEDGDCTGDDETIETVNVGFTPMTMTRVEEGYALLLSDEMGVPLDESSIPYSGAKDVTLQTGTVAMSEGSSEADGTSDMTTNDIPMHNGLFEVATATAFKAKTSGGSEIFSVKSLTTGHIAQVKISGWLRDGYRIYLSDNYKADDELESPMQTHDWGLMMGIMRSSDSGSQDASVEAHYDTIEKENPLNEYWYIKPGALSTSHSDTCDDEGNEWDYTQSDEDIGSRDGRISLKLRAEKPNPNYDSTQPENNTTNRRYLEITNPNLRGRGLCDQFYKEYSYWIRNARIVKRTVRMELAQLLAIDKAVRVTVGDVTGFIRKMQYSVSNKTGLGNVTMEIMYI